MKQFKYTSDYHAAVVDVEHATTAKELVKFLGVPDNWVSTLEQAFKFDKDGNVEIFSDFQLGGDRECLPFNATVAHKNFDISGCDNLVTLLGCPKHVKGNLLLPSDTDRTTHIPETVDGDCDYGYVVNEDDVVFPFTVRGKLKARFSKRKEHYTHFLNIFQMDYLGGFESNCDHLNKLVNDMLGSYNGTITSRFKIEFQMMIRKTAKEF